MKSKKRYVLLLFACLVVACSPSQQREKFALAESVGNFLIEIGADRKSVSFVDAEDVPGIVRLGPGLANALNELAPVLEQECYIKTKASDIGSPLGDGSGTHHFFILCNDVQWLGVRLRYDEKLQKFHILGFWMVQN